MTDELRTPQTQTGRRAVSLGVDLDVVLGIETEARAPLAREITKFYKDLAIEAEARAPLEAENERLRVALQRFIDHHHEHTIVPCPEEDIARAVLETPQGECSFCEYHPDGHHSPLVRAALEPSNGR